MKNQATDMVSAPKGAFSPKIEVFSPFRGPFSSENGEAVDIKQIDACCACTACSACTACK